MLLFERREGQGFSLGGIAQIRVAQVRSGNRVKIAVEAPRHVAVWRDELDGRREDSRSPFADLTVLFVEDDEDFAGFVDDALRLHGVRGVSRVATSAEAVEHLERVAATPDEPTIALVDYHLPGMAGADLVRWIRRHPVLKRTPTVMLSGADDEATVDECFDAGANAFMKKPDDFTGVVRTLERLLVFWADPARIG